MKSRLIRIRSAVLAAILSVFMMMSSLSVTAFAFDNGVKEGVCAVVFYLRNAYLCNYNTSSDEFVPYRSLGDMEYSGGSGFFVGNQGQNPQYIVTNEHVVDSYINANEGGRYVEYIGPDSDGYAVYIVAQSCEMRIYYSQDDYDIAFVDCYGDMNKVDLAVLDIKEPTDKRRPLQIKALTDDMVGDSVYTVGYPGNADNDYSSASKYGVEDATVHKGTISRIVMNEGKGVERISTDATIQHGNSGGPLISEDGYVLGVNTNVESNSPYESQIEVDYYSISSNELMTFLDKNNIPYETASSSSGVGVILFIIIGAVVVVIAIVIVIIVMTNKKKAAPASGTPMANGTPMTNGVPMANGAPMAYGAPGVGGPAPVASMMSAVIRSMSAQHNGKTYPVGKAPVTIGRNASSCVIVYMEGTQGVSGIHCSVSFDGATGVFTLTDLGSTFGTFLASGQKLMPNTPVALRSGDCFYVGDKVNMCRVEVVK